MRDDTLVVIRINLRSNDLTEIKMIKHVLDGIKTYIHKDHVLAYLPTHPSAWKNGLIYYHRLVLENHLGRYLLPSEHVHHIDENPLNNSVTNLEILTNVEHTKRHHPRILQDKTCKACGKIFRPHKKTANFCSIDCTKKSTKLANLSKDELTKLVWELPLTKIGELYSVSDNAIKKRCIKLGITRPKMGFWIKVDNRL